MNKANQPYINANPCPPPYSEMTVTSTSTPAFNHDGTALNVTDNGDGTYLVQVDDATYVKFANTSSSGNVTEVVVHYTDGIEDMKQMFYPSSSNKMSNLTNVTFENTADTSKVTDIESMFEGCPVLTSLDLSNFDTSSVTDMQTMFYESGGLTSLDLSNFDTSNVTSMYAMFYSCSNLTSVDVSSFDTSNVTSMNYMFGSCSSLPSLDISNFDTSNSPDMASMFDGCSNITYIKMPDDIDTVKPSGSMYGLFSGCSSLECITKIDTTNASSTNNIFNNCTSLVHPTSAEQDDIKGKTNQPYINTNPCPSTLDLDGDGNPDTSLFEGPTTFGQTTITEDTDSINIDINGDNQADIIIPK